MSSKLVHLRSTVAQLQEYELPERYQTQPPSEQVEPTLNEGLLQRYNKARNEYLQKRVQEVFYDHVRTWDGTSMQMPTVPTEDEQKELEDQREEARKQLLETVSEVNRQMQLLQDEYTTFCTRRDELGHIVQEMEESEAREGGSQDDDDADTMDDDVDEEEMALEEQRLASLGSKRTELEAELRRIRSETAQAKASLEESQQSILQMQKARGAQPAVVSPSSTTEFDLTNLDQVEAKRAELENRVKELREMSEWYDSMRATVEELGGLKILGVEEAPANGDNDGETNGLLVTVLLLGKHKVQLGLSPNRLGAKKKSKNDELHLSSAKFLTESVVRAPTGDSQDKNEGQLQMSIPPLDDLVQIGANLGPVEDLKFLLREAAARIRTTTARVEELSLLDKRYLTKIGKSSDFDYGFGGEDQEVVCGLNEGLTVVLRLTPDCPMVDGSVYIAEIVGTGGWDEEVLGRLRDTVNATRCRGPLVLMDSLLTEINRLETEEGMSLPRTPKLPDRRAL